MSIFDRMFGIVRRPLSIASGAVPIMPEIKVVRRWQAMEPVVIKTQADKDRRHRHMAMYGKEPLSLNHRRLERNKYAPWGRGDLSGLPV